MAVANTTAYYKLATIITVRVQLLTLVACTIKLFRAEIVVLL
jgi:hypothetical protein